MAIGRTIRDEFDWPLFIAVSTIALFGNTWTVQSGSVRGDTRPTEPPSTHSDIFVYVPFFNDRPGPGPHAFQFHFGALPARSQPARACSSTWYFAFQLHIGALQVLSQPARAC